MSEKKFYVTTPIYYATAAPHLGTLYSTVLADIAMRWHKLQGIDTFFLTGTDEYGQKVAQAAQAAGKEPKTFVDQFIGAYKDLWKQYEIEYSHFIRTTDETHGAAVQQWIRDLQKKGDIYKGLYEGWYCTPCETFITDKDNEQGHKNPACPTCERPTEWVAEDCYFFKLSAYQDKLLQFYKDNPDFVTPKERLAEVVSFVKSGLQDLSISRTTLTWGIPFPGDEKHVTYVWADALNNYLTGIGYGQKGREKEFKKWWPADLQVLGKDIIRFHAVYWPAFLMASDLALPKQLLVHGWIKVGDYKMSKSRGNSVDPHVLLKNYGADAVRYYLARQLAITQDGQFTIEDLEQKIASDLANDLGNLLQRSVSLALKHGLTTIPAVTDWQAAEEKLQKESVHAIERCFHEMERSYFHLALADVWKLLHEANAYFHGQEPWSIFAKASLTELRRASPDKYAGQDDSAKFVRVLSATLHSLKVAATLLWPVMPSKMEELLARIGVTLQFDTNNLAQCAVWNSTFTLTEGTPLFTKPEPAPAIEPDQANLIDLEQFLKVDLHVGTITTCEFIPESDKLLKLEVDFGHLGTRCILSGVRASYAPEELMGKQGIFITNLKPRMMLKKYESQGMMLFVKGTDGKMVFATVDKVVPNGHQLQ